MANEFYISAGLPPIDNSEGAASNTAYVAAGLIPDDVETTLSVSVFETVAVEDSPTTSSPYPVDIEDVVISIVSARTISDIVETVAVVDSADVVISTSEIPAVVDSLEFSDSVTVYAVPISDLDISNVVDSFETTDSVVIEEIGIDSGDIVDSVEFSDNVTVSVPVVVEDIIAEEDTGENLNAQPLADPIAVEDSASVVLPDALELSVYEEIAVSDYTSAALPDLEVSDYDVVEFEDSGQASVLSAEDVNVEPLPESFTLTDTVSLSIDDLEASTYDETTISENVVASEDALDISVDDLTNLEDSGQASVTSVSDRNAQPEADTFEITESTTLSISDLEADVFDLTTISDVTTDALSDLEASVFDTTEFSDSAAVLSESLQVDVVDSVAFEDSGQVEVGEIPDRNIQPFETVEITDAVNVTTEAISGTICWGHDSDVVENVVKDFTGNWTGTGDIVGSGDAEAIEIDSGETMESETWETGAVPVKITPNKYGTGIGVVHIEYKTGDSVGNCEADSWHEYVGSFISSGYVKVKVST